MLKKKYRLNLKKSFTFLVSGERISGEPFNIFFRFSDSEQVKLGVVTSKHDFGKAVQRNRAKRLIYSGLAVIYKSLPPKLNIMVVAKPKVLDLSLSEVKSQLEQMLKKHNL